MIPLPLDVQGGIEGGLEDIFRFGGTPLYSPSERGRKGTTPVIPAQAGIQNTNVIPPTPVIPAEAGI